jgi:hypothetical protein
MGLSITAAVLAATVVAVAGCAAPSAPAVPPATEHHRELHLRAPTPQVSVALDGKQVDVVLADVPHDGAAAPLGRVWASAFPTQDASPLHFDLLGSDGFHPSSRPACARLLTGAEVAAARIDVATHDVSFDDGVKLPGCYRVKGAVRIEASR